MAARAQQACCRSMQVACSWTGPWRQHAWARWVPALRWTSLPQSVTDGNFCMCHRGGQPVSSAVGFVSYLGIYQAGKRLVVGQQDPLSRTKQASPLVGAVQVTAHQFALFLLPCLLFGRSLRLPASWRSRQRWAAAFFLPAHHACPSARTPSARTLFEPLTCVRRATLPSGLQLVKSHYEPLSEVTAVVVLCNVM